LPKEPTGSSGSGDRCSASCQLASLPVPSTTLTEPSRLRYKQYLACQARIQKAACRFSPLTIESCCNCVSTRASREPSLPLLDCSAHRPLCEATHPLLSNGVIIVLMLPELASPIQLLV